MGAINIPIFLLIFPSIQTFYVLLLGQGCLFWVCHFIAWYRMSCSQKENSSLSRFHSLLMMRAYSAFKKSSSMSSQLFTKHMGRSAQKALLKFFFSIGILSK